MEEIIEKLKVQLIEQLNLEDIEPDEIEADEALFGDEGIGLDSIDALEIIVLLEKEYGVKLEDPKQGKDVFYSVQTLAKYISEHQS